MTYDGAFDVTFKATVASLCAYETVAITTGKVPTITALCGKYPILIPVILGGLTAHFHTVQVISQSWRKVRGVSQPI